MNENSFIVLDREIETLIESIECRYPKLYKKVTKNYSCDYLFLLKEAQREKGKSLIIQMQYYEDEDEIIVSFHVPSALKTQLLVEFKGSDEDSELGKYSLIGGESFPAAFLDEHGFVRINVIVSRNSSSVIYDLACQVVSSVFK